MQMTWTECPRNERAEAGLVRELGLKPLTARLLVNRGLTEPGAAEAFLHPKLADLHDPFELPDMDRAARRIADAVRDKETIFVYGDYDVDGVTSTAVYVRTLSKLGGLVVHRVPHRHTDGYDLTLRSILCAHECGASLIITTDCGIQAREAVDHANSLGLCVIVTDHHEPGDTLPNAFAVVNPRRHDSKYPFSDLAGVGVAFKTMQAVTRLVRPEWEAAFLQNFLDLVAIGTVADVMPLLGENRILATYGLEALRRTKKTGLRALLDGAGIDTSEPLSADAVGFGLGPRINAVGRIDDASHALELLLTSDNDEAKILVQRLNECNRERQSTQKQIQREAVEKVIRDGLAEQPVMVVADRGWNAGVIGIVAGKLVEQFHRPAIVIGVSDDGTRGKGSARSIAAFDIFGGIVQCQDILESCGGHSHAAGLSLMMEHFETFRFRLCAHAASILSEEDFRPVVRIDAMVSGSDVTMAMVEEWDRLQPHGQGNPAPHFASRNLRIGQKRRMGKDLTHLKFSVDCPHAELGRWQAECIGWGLAAEWDSRIEPGGDIDIAYVPSINRYQGRRSLQFVIKDIAACGAAASVR